MDNGPSDQLRMENFRNKILRDGTSAIRYDSLYDSLTRAPSDQTFSTPSDAIFLALVFKSLLSSRFLINFRFLDANPGQFFIVHLLVLNSTSGHYRKWSKIWFLCSSSIMASRLPISLSKLWIILSPNQTITMTISCLSDNLRWVIWPHSWSQSIFFYKIPF